MPGSNAAVARATAAVFVDNRRTGSAVLVDSRHLLTCAHVLIRRHRDTGRELPVAQTEVEFPTTSTGDPSLRLPVSRVVLSAMNDELDVAVLDLGEAAPSCLPAPVRVSGAERTPQRVKVFGYPLAEGALNGIWREFTVAGHSADGSVQLDWAGGVGTFPGHSGSPVIDCISHSLAGILAEGSESGHFDRFLPLTLIARAWPKLPRSWLIVGAGQTDARDHFIRRALGQRSVARGGDLFRGRQAALIAIREWLTDMESPGLPLVVMGQPGAGKSAVLARAVLDLETRRDLRGLAFHARAATIEDFLISVADLIGIEPSASPDEFIGAVALMHSPTRAHVLAVDALDEAASESDRRKITSVLAELSVLSGLRVAIATRALSSGKRYVLGGLLAALGVTGPNSRNLIDLDADTYFDSDDLKNFATALLAQQAVDRPGPPEAAWEKYRADQDMCDRLAAVIASRAKRNFLVAAMAAVPLSIERDVMDPASEAFDLNAIPSAVGEGLDKYLDHLPEVRRVRERGLLTALAYGRGDGLDDQRWLTFSDALGYPATTVDLDVLRSSPAADYLLQTMPSGVGGRQVTRLFHQALADELFAMRYRSGDESLLLDVLVNEAERIGWTGSYLERYSADHAASAGRLGELIERPQYLLAADPVWLTPLLDTVESADSRAIASVYKQAAHLLTELDPASRASQLEFYAYRLGDHEMATRFGLAAPERPWRTIWSHTRRDSDHQTLANATPINALILATLPDGTTAVIGGGYEGVLWMRRLTDGSPVDFPSFDHQADVLALTIGTLPGGTPVLISGADYEIRIWRLVDGALLRTVKHRAWALAFGSLHDGTPVIISGAGDGIRMWRLTDGASLPTYLSAYRGQVRELAVGTLPDGTAAIVASGMNGIRAWRLTDGVPLRTRHTVYNRSVSALKVTTLPDGTSVVIAGSENGEICVSNLADGSILRRFDSGHDGEVSALTVGTLLDGVSTIVSGAHDGTIRLHRLSDGAPVGYPFIGHVGPVRAVSVARPFKSTPVIVSGGFDDTVRVWPLTTDAAHAAASATWGQESVIEQVALGALPDGTRVVVSAGPKGIRIWHLADGKPIGSSIDHASVAIVVCDLPDGTPVIVSGSGDEVRVWRMADGSPYSAPITVEVGELNAVTTSSLPDGTPVVVSGGSEGVSVWPLMADAGNEVTLLDDDYEVRSVVASSMPDGMQVIVAGNRDGIVRVIRLADAVQSCRWDAGDSSLTAMAAGALPDNTPVVAVGNDSGEIQAFRLADGALIWGPFRGHGDEVSSLAIGATPGGVPAIVSGCWDGSMRVWRLTDGAPIVPRLQLPGSIHSIAMSDDMVAVAAVSAISVHCLSPSANK